jgi:hypothetical protein
MMVYCKTDKGQSEIQTRAHRLPPRLRQALILVDGKRDEDALAALIPEQALVILNSLLTEGFIQLAQTTAPVTRQPVKLSPTPRPQNVDSLRREVVRALNEELGPIAEAMSARIDKAKSMAELGPAIDQAVELLRAWRDEETADVFAARFVA